MRRWVVVTILQYKVPVGVSSVWPPAGRLHVTFATEKQKGPPNKGDALSLRHNSLMTMISGGLKKLFEDDRDKERREGGSAGEPISQAQRRLSGEMSSPRRGQRAEGDESARGAAPLPPTRPNAIQVRGSLWHRHSLSPPECRLQKPSQKERLLRVLECP